MCVCVCVCVCTHGNLGGLAGITLKKGKRKTITHCVVAGAGRIALFDVAHYHIVLLLADAPVCVCDTYTSGMRVCDTYTSGNFDNK